MPPRSFSPLTPTLRRKIRELTTVHGSLSAASVAIGRSKNGLRVSLKTGRLNRTTIRLINEAHTSMRLPKEGRRPATATLSPASHSPPSGNLRTVLGLLESANANTGALLTRLDDIEKRQVANFNDTSVALGKISAAVQALRAAWGV